MCGQVCECACQRAKRRSLALAPCSWLSLTTSALRAEEILCRQKVHHVCGTFRSTLEFRLIQLSTNGARNVALVRVGDLEVQQSVAKSPFAPGKFSQQRGLAYATTT